MSVHIVSDHYGIVAVYLDVEKARDHVAKLRTGLITSIEVRDAG